MHIQNVELHTYCLLQIVTSENYQVYINILRSIHKRNTFSNNIIVYHNYHKLEILLNKCSGIVLDV